MTRVQRAAVWTVFVLGGLVLLGCGDRVEQNINKLSGSQEEREQAKMELALAKREAIEPLIRVLGDPSTPSTVRVDVAEVLFRLYLREDDPCILEALIGALNDSDPTLRAGVATALGDMGKDEAIPPLLDAFEREQDDCVIYELLVAFESFGPKVFQSVVDIEGICEGNPGRFVQALRKTISATASQKVRRQASEWLERIAEQIAQKAGQLVLKGSLEEAEKRYFEAKALVPDSKNINQKLGKFYYDNGDEQKGLDILTQHRMVTYATKLWPPPTIDGILDDPCWTRVKPITEFYQCIFNMAAYPTEGKSEAYVGYAKGSFFVAVKGYEPSTKTMTAEITRRDGPVSRDDCAEIYVDTNHDRKTYYQIIVNSLGTIFDQEIGGQREAWDGSYDVATVVEDTFWSLEIEIPFRELGDTQVKKGTVWGFNLARVRIGNASEFGQWVPTYGAAHRPGRFGFLFFE